MPKRTNQGRALIALLEFNSILDAAKACRLSEETLFRYLRDLNFVTYYREARTRAVELAISKLQNATGEAVVTLVKNLQCENPAVEVRTAQIILESANKGIERLGVLVRQYETMRMNENYHYERQIEGYNKVLKLNPQMTTNVKANGIKTNARISGLDEKELRRRAGLSLETAGK